MGIGPVVGIGLFGGTGPVVSLTYIVKLLIQIREISKFCKKLYVFEEILSAHFRESP